MASRASREPQIVTLEAGVFGPADAEVTFEPVPQDGSADEQG